jgi:hypothetical protein
VTMARCRGWRTYCRFNAGSIGINGCAILINLGPYAPFPLYSAARREPANRVGLGAPDQGAIKESDTVLEPCRMRSILIFFPLISSYTFILITCTSHLFLNELIYRACCIMTVTSVPSDTMTTVHLSILK